MKKALSFLAVLLIVSAFGGTLYYLYAKSEEPPLVYETKSPEIATIVKKTVATGSVVPRKEVEIKPNVSGILEEIVVEPGDEVKKGDLIARIRIVPDMVSLNNAESRVNLARIRLENAKKDLKRSRGLATEGTISEADLQEFEEEHERAQEELEAAVSNLELIKEGSSRKSGAASNTLVKATIDGMVLEVPLEVGASVIESNTFNDGTTIATIADMKDMIFEGQVDESEVGKIRPGMDLVLTIGAIDSQRFEASLEHIAPKGIEDEGAIQFEIRAALTLQEGTFVRANYSANADIVLGKAEDVLALNESLLQFEEGKPYVEVAVGPQSFERRQVETGLSDGIMIEITSGLAEGDAVKDPNSGKPQQG